MQIRELESKTNLDRATIRFYEREGLVLPQRMENGYRIYSEQDCDTLLKIKLLRQLEMPLDRIKELQQGSGNLQSALAQQIRLLESKREQLGRAVMVCTEMKVANVQYTTLNASYYLDRLTRSDQTSTATIKKDFREPLRREYHPIRRYVARMLDKTLMEGILFFLIYVILRIRISGEWLTAVIGFASAFILVYIHAWMLSKYGTTPGKWCMGLRVESENGGNLSYFDALEREKTVLSRGLGFHLPIYHIWRLYKSYIRYRDADQPLDWDWYNEYIYRPRKRTQKASAFVVILIIFSLILAVSTDRMLPRYRGDITLAEFSTNYNYYLPMFVHYSDDSDKLQPDGSPYPQSLLSSMTVHGGNPTNNRFVFDYETEGERLQKITYRNSWTNGVYINPLDYRCQNAAVTAVMSQKGMNLTDLFTFDSIWDKEISKPVGKIIYDNVEINWKIESDNCIASGSGLYLKDNQDIQSSLSIRFEILIHAIS